MNCYLRRDRQRDEKIKALAADGADRATILSKLGLSTSSIDVAIKRLVKEGVLVFEYQPRRRSVYTGSRSVERLVRVYYLS